MTTKNNKPTGIVALGLVSGAQAFDASQGNVCQMTASGGNITLTVTNIRPGEQYGIYFAQDVVGGRTLTIAGASVVGTVTPNPIASARTVFSFFAFDATTLLLSGSGVVPSTSGITSTDNLTLVCAATKSIILQEGAGNNTVVINDSDPFSAGVSGSAIDLTGAASGVSYINGGSANILYMRASQTRIVDSAGVQQLNVSAGICAIGTSVADGCRFDGKVGFYATTPVTKQVLANATGDAGAAVSLVDVGAAPTQANINANFAAIWKKLNNYGLWA